MRVSRHQRRRSVQQRNAYEHDWQTPLHVDANADETNEPVLAATASAFMYAVDGFDQSSVLLQTGGEYTLRLPNTLANASAMALTYWFVQTVHGKRNTKCVRRYRLAHTLHADAVVISPSRTDESSDISIPLTSSSRAESANHSSPRSSFSLDGVDADDDSADFLSATDTGSDDADANDLMPSEHCRRRKRRFSSVDTSNIDEVCIAPSSHLRRTLHHSEWKCAEMDDALTSTSDSTSSWAESYLAELSPYDSDIPSLIMTSEDFTDLATPTDRVFDESTFDCALVNPAQTIASSPDSGACVCRPTMFEVCMAMSESNTATDTRVVELLSSEYRTRFPESLTLRCDELKSKSLVIFQVSNHADSAHIEFAVPRWRDLNADAQRAFTSLSHLVAPLQGTATFRLTVAVRSLNQHLCEFVLNVVLRTNNTGASSRISSAVDTRRQHREIDDATGDSVLVQMEIRIPRACLSALPSLNTLLAHLVRSYTDKCPNQTALDAINIEFAAIRWFIAEAQSVDGASLLVEHDSLLHVAVAIGDVISCRRICDALHIDPTNGGHSVSAYELLIVRQRQCPMANLLELQEEWTMEYVYAAIARLFAGAEETALSSASSSHCENTLRHIDKPRRACLNLQSQASLDDDIASLSKRVSHISFNDFLFEDESARIASELGDLRIVEDELVSACDIAIDAIAEFEHQIGEQTAGAFELQTTELDSVWPVYTSAFQCRSEHDIVHVTLVSPAHSHLIIDRRTPVLVTGRVRMLWSRQPLRLAVLTRRHARQHVAQLQLAIEVKRDALQQIETQIVDVRSKQSALQHHTMLLRTNAQQQHRNTTDRTMNKLQVISRPNQVDL